MRIIMVPHRATSVCVVLVLGLLLGHETGAQETRSQARLRAEIHSPAAVWFTLTGVVRPVEPSAYRLTDADGRGIPIV